MNRSTSYASWIASLIATAALVLAQGCSEDALTPSGAAGDETPAFDGRGNGESSSYGADAAATLPSDQVRGSPLCRVRAGNCMPDDDDAKSSTSAVFCEQTDASLKGCRLEGDDESSIVPACLGVTAQGIDGAKCKSGDQCAPGFDCVDQADGAVCRRYCCTGSCADQTSQNGGATFCDIQRLVERHGVKAPVCMPLKRCALLTAGECGEKETCSIVTEQGETGCVANGNAQAGQSCEKDHCSTGLTCLGTAGSRTCYQLCKTDGSVPCGPSQACKTNTLFTSSAFGVCKDLAAARN